MKSRHIDRASAASALEIKLMSKLPRGHALPDRLVEVGPVSDVWRGGRIFGSKFKGGNEDAESNKSAACGILVKNR